MTSHDDRIGPGRNQARHIVHHDRLAEHGTIQDIPDGAIGRAPHLLQAKLLHTRFVGRNGGALDTNTVLLNRVGGVDRDLIVGLVALLHAEVVVLEVHIEVRVDEGVLDGLPDNAGHLVAVKLDDRSFNLDLLHVLLLESLLA